MLSAGYCRFHEQIGDLLVVVDKSTGNCILMFVMGTV